MIPLRIDGANVIFHGPEGIADLHVLVVEGVCISRWAPTPDELAMLNAGGSVELLILGMQPIVCVRTAALVVHEETADG